MKELDAACDVLPGVVNILGDSPLDVNGRAQNLAPNIQEALLREKKTALTERRFRSLRQLRLLEVGHDVGEDIANGWPKQGQDDDHDHCNEHEDKRVLNQTLTFFTRIVHHDDFS